MIRSATNAHIETPNRVRWRGKIAVTAAWLGLAVAIIHPPHGTGITVCWLKLCTGLPCPGCGLTRSLSCGIRGMFSESWQYHPFGLFILTYFLITATVSILPKSARDLVLQRMDAHAPLLNKLYVLFVLGFLTFGVARAFASYPAAIRLLAGG